jgi:hypothetical protein
MALTTANGGRLDVSERAALLKCEKTIEEGRRTFVEVGNALAAIRDARLYRESHKTFEAYCRQRWDIGRAHAYRLIESAAVASNLSPIGDKSCPSSCPSSQPQSEAAARALAKAPPEKRAEVMQAVADASKAPTAAAIKKAVESVARANDSEREDDSPQPIPAIVSAVSRGKIKATTGQLAALAAFDEETQEALLKSILAGKQTVAQAIEAGCPPEPTLEEEREAINSEIESFCRRLMHFVEQNCPQDKWLDHMGRRDGAIQKIKDACAMLRTCKTVAACPKCEGEGCRSCLNTGRVTRYALEQMS